MSGAVASTYGLAFSISPAPKKKQSKKTNRDEDDDEYILTLAPFTRVPKINFGEVKVNTLVERILLITNPQDFTVKLNVTNQDLDINNMEIDIPKNTNVDFKIRWQPEKPGKYKYAIMFEVIEGAKLKFLVHAFGICQAPVAAKKILQPPRKPLTMLQPLKKEKSTLFNEPTTVNKTKPILSSKPPAQFQTKVSKENKEGVIKKSSSTTFAKTSIQATNRVLVQAKPVVKNLKKFDDLYKSFSDDEDYENKPGNKFLEQKAADLRRQTSILASPNAKYEPVYLRPDDHRTPMRRSMSAASIASPTSFLAAGGVTNLASWNSPSLSSTLKKGNKPLETEPTKPSEVRKAVDLTPQLNDFLKQSNYKSKLNVLPNIVVVGDNDELEAGSTTSTATTYQASYRAYNFGTPQILTKTASRVNDIYSMTPGLDEEISKMKKEKIENKITLIGKDLKTKFYDLRYVNCVVKCQKHWRMKIFRRRVRIIRFEISQQLIHQTLANFRSLETDEQCIAKALADAKRRQEERRQRLIAAVCLMQRSFRMKKFRRALYELKLSQCVIMCQRVWRMKKFRRCVAALKQQKFEFEQTVKTAIICQRWRRMKNFRVNLNRLKTEAENLNKMVIRCQRSLRMKLFRHSLHKLIAEREHFLNCVKVCQKSFRMKKFRKNLEVLREKARVEKMHKSALILQRQWRVRKFRKAMSRFRNAAIKIQQWIREKNERIQFIRLKRAAVYIQLKYKQKFERKVKAAIVLQKYWRMKSAQKKFQKTLKSIVMIQKWIKERKDRFRYLKLKRSLPLVQQKAREFLIWRRNASIKIQHAYRMHKFRVAMKRLRNAALTIQTWHRSMKLRYEFLQKKRIVVEIQIVYRKVYMVRRGKAAVKIQSVWRGYCARKLRAQLQVEYEARAKVAIETQRLNKYATTIQCTWRGYMVRKQTDSILNSIRNRLSIIYIQNSSSHPEQTKTLGSRIRNSLTILRFPCVPIQQIIFALMDLDKVTRLSPECCQLFSREGALDILYAFIANCNRSVPHMDLIKFCLQIFINLAKYSETVMYILEPSNSLIILANLLVAYQSSNPSIFMDVCILFILLSQWKPLAEHLLSQDGFIRKLQTIYSALERRATFKSKTTSTISNPQLNSTINNAANNVVSANNPTSASAASLTTAVKKSLNVSFTTTPEWSLSRKCSIELVEPLGALEYLLNTLGVRIETVNQQTAPKTPSKRRSLNHVKELSAQKKLEKASSIDHVDAPSNFIDLPKSRKTISKIPMMKTPNQPSKSSQILLKSATKTKTTITTESKQANLNGAASADITDLDEFLCESSNESCFIDTTIKSVASFHVDKPKMNSTSIFMTKNQTTKTAQSGMLPPPPPPLLPIASSATINQQQQSGAKPKQTTQSTRRKLI